eukprot:CCRYP_004089-RA/>CCRYP_004089-RA protein AED:0.36 eAED:-0.67 QI:0/0/0/1/1/1/2/0/1086
MVGTKDSNNQANDMDTMVPGFAESARVLLENIPAEDSNRNGLVRTPQRFAQAMAFLLQGYNQKVIDVLSPEAIFDDDHKEPIVVKDINIFSLCEHHLLPFYGKVHVAYIPRDGKIVGLSKLARLAEIYARRLQVQERLTRQIANDLVETLCPLGVGVIVECTHLCMSMRGVRSVESTTVTTVRYGCYEQDDELWRDFWGQVFQCKVPNAVERSSSGPIFKSNIESSPCVDSTPDVCCRCLGSNQMQDVIESLHSAQHSNADDYRLYTQCSHEEFNKMIQIIKDSCFGLIVDNKIQGFSLLDIGAGTGHVLKKLVSPSVDVIPSRYVAFEPDADAMVDLNKMLESADCRVPDYKTFNHCFNTSVSVEDAGGRFDVVLLSHVLYGFSTRQVEELFHHCLKFVSPGGVLLIFHHSGSEKLDVLRDFMVKEQIMFYQKDYSAQVDVAALTPSEQSRIKAYIKSTSSEGNVISRKLSFIAVEPSNCHPIQGEKLRCAIQQRKVSYAARSVVPAAICAPNSVVGIQACLRAASEQKYGFDSISVIGGGHSANCIAKDALAVDMRCWKKVDVNPNNMVVCAGGGATCGDITRAAEKEGLLVPLGDRPGVGIGLILAGGINHYMRKFGLAIDNIIRLVYVSPCGKLLVAEDEEQLMRFKGAGSNFGVVVEVILQAHPIGIIMNQHVQYSFHKWCSATDILGSYSSYATELQVSECIDAFLFFKADELVIATSHFHLAEKEEDCHFTGRNIFLDHPCFKSSTHGNVMTHKLPSELYDHELYMTESFSVQSATTKVYPKGYKLLSVKKCLLFLTLQGQIETELIESMKNAPTKWCYVHILHGGGKVKEVAPCLTSFCARRWNFAAVITGRWPDGDEILHNQTKGWVKLTMKRLIPHTVGIYSTDLGPGDYDLRHLAYEPRNLIQLAELKRKHDPQMVLRHSCPLVDQNESGIGDSYGQSRGVVIIVSGRRHSGKDWLGNIIQAQLRKLLGAQAKSLVNLVSISEGTKLAYAKEVGLDGDLLLRSRKYKEQHRAGLLQYYERKKALDAAFDRKCFVELVQKHSNGGILIVTGMRDGVDYARWLSGRPTLFVLLESDY